MIVVIIKIMSIVYAFIEMFSEMLRRIFAELEERRRATRE